MTNKRHKVTKIKCKRRESTGKESLFVELNFAAARSQRNSKHRPGETTRTNLHLTVRLILQTLFHVITMAFWGTNRRCLPRNESSSQVRWETSAFYSCCLWDKSQGELWPYMFFLFRFLTELWSPLQSQWKESRWILLPTIKGKHVHWTKSNEKKKELVM